MRRPWSVVLFGLLAVIVMGSLFAPLIAPYDPLDGSHEPLQPPSHAHFLGTDLIGRDVFSRVLHGGALTLLTAALSLLLSVLPGLALGAAVGAAGNAVDQGVSALLDALLAIPGLLTALTVIALVGNGPIQVALAVGIAGFPAYARVARAATRVIRVQPYIEAARSIGARPGYILRRHVLPNIARPLIGFATVTLGWAILNAATLNFLGFGGDPAVPEWGAMLADGRGAFRAAPWVAFGPGVAILVTLCTINLLADATQ